jgi:peptide/nickel transport system substrate-binding protein
MKHLQVNRRDFLRLSGLASMGVLATACGQVPTAPAPPAADGVATSAPAAAPAEATGLREVPRERTFIGMFGGDGTQFVDVGLANLYATGATFQMGNNAIWEPLFYYSAFANEQIPWLATGYSYNDDFSVLTVTLREGVEWSDGTPFTANDVAFTLNMLRDNAPTLTRSQAVKASMTEAVVVDDLTVQLTFVGPRPRFAEDMLFYKFGTGIHIVPEHLFKDVEDIAAFGFYDPEKGWPVTTGPYQITSWNNSQKFMDLRDEWWGTKTGFKDKMPAVERILVLPRADDTLMVQRVVNNEIDSCLDLRATVIPQVVVQNPNVITHTGKEPPYGYMDWWPTSMWFNHLEGPYTAKEVRWAVSYSIDRQQMLEVGLQGSGILTELPFPQFPAMQPFFDAAKPLLEKYPTNEFNLEKAAALMEGQGYSKDGEGFWVKDGERIPAVIGGWAVFNDIGPIIAEQLRRGGFEAEYTTPADQGTRISDGTAKIWLNGHAGSVTDPFTTLDYYTSKYFAPMGEPTAQNSRFTNAEYDAILEQMAAMSSDNPEYMDLYLAALEIWLDNLVDAPIQQWLHRIPMNQTYWTGWPTEEDPYINGAFWPLTFPLILHRLEPAT